MAVLPVPLQVNHKPGRRGGEGTPSKEGFALHCLLHWGCSNQWGWEVPCLRSLSWEKEGPFSGSFPGAEEGAGGSTKKDGGPPHPPCPSF